MVAECQDWKSVMGMSVVGAASAERIVKYGSPDRSGQPFPIYIHHGPLHNSG